MFQDRPFETGVKGKRSEQDNNRAQIDKSITFRLPLRDREGRVWKGMVRRI